MRPSAPGNYVVSGTHSDFQGAIQRNARFRSISGSARRDDDAASFALLLHDAPAQFDDIEDAPKVHIQKRVLWLKKLPFSIRWKIVLQEYLSARDASIREHHVDMLNSQKAAAQFSPVSDVAFPVHYTVR